MSDVARMRGELAAILEVVRSAGGLSDIAAAETIAAKALLLSAASYFEREICSAIMECAAVGGVNSVYVKFIEKQALERRYHSMFSWSAANLNSFFALFGDQAKLKLSNAAKEDDVAAAIRDFLFLGSMRNDLVHQNFAAFSLDVTFEDVWDKYERAARLPTWLRERFVEIAAE